MAELCTKADATRGTVSDLLLTIPFSPPPWYIAPPRIKLTAAEGAAWLRRKVGTDEPGHAGEQGTDDQNLGEVDVGGG